METNAAWWSLEALNAEVPDHHHDSTVENLDGIFDASDELRCVRKEHVPVDEIESGSSTNDADGVAHIGCCGGPGADLVAAPSGG
ncbi:hypothetical protein [Micromonospora sp. WMMD998]|uniref:hypothetical protein n=1 Tax=Micromonospora sp. WMMD998 TaxID=3016092 RepID=UPI00249A2A40|nr:hypothetical protein [Micromonospora sp. WMMD998]WFE41108.1 hypothetical protein O7619_22635 [Micromonospora sp. WMMD998]